MLKEANMKFINGAWLMREGVDPYYVAELRSYDITDNKVTLYAPFQGIRHRGDTLTGPLFTIEISAPQKECFKVKLYHYNRDVQFPTFDLTEELEPLKTMDHEDHLEIISGQSKMIISKKDWKITYYHNNKVLTSSGFRGLGMMKLDGDKFMCESLNLGVGEKFMV
jgi:alpha-D-xyloside xylohydrolase